MSLSTITKNKRNSLSHIEMIERGVWSGYSLFAKQFSRFSLGISKSHSRMYLKWTSQNLTCFANSLSLSLSGKLFLLLSFTSCKYDMSPFEVEVVCTDFIGKMISHRRESNAIRSPLIMKHMYLLRSFAPSTASRLAVSSFWRNGVQCTG